MTDQEKIEFIIKYLGFRGCCATLRVSKDRLICMRASGMPMTANVSRYAIKTIQAIHNILNGKPALKYVDVYFSYNRGITLEEIRASDKKISIYTLDYISEAKPKTVGV